jgi:membrane-associated HD superfamily phosphohydrolase
VDFDPARLRRGEVIVGAGAIVLLASMFVLKWYGSGGGSVTGWDALTTLRWLMLVTIAVALALVYTQMTRRSPAVPVTLSVIVTVLGVVTALALIYRVLINEPGPDSVISQKAGSFVGLLSAIAIVIGGYLSMRDEGVADRDAPSEIETVTLPRTETPSS